MQKHLWQFITGELLTADGYTLVLLAGAGICAVIYLL